jgi:TonB family protein
MIKPLTPFHGLLVLLSAIVLGETAASQNVEPSPSAPPSGRTHPRMDFKHTWHLDLPSKLMSQGQFGTCLVRFQVDPDGGIRVAQVVRSTGFPQLDLACVQNILHQTLLPATDHGVATTEWVTWPISMNAKTPPASERNTSGVPQIQQFFALKTNLADYPAVARQVHEYKDCRVRIWVAPDATVEKLEVTQSTGIEMLDQACRAVVQEAPFTAASQNGSPIGAFAEVTMRWSLR